MGNVSTGGSKTSSNSAAVRTATDKLATQVGNMAGGTSYVAPSATTQTGWEQALSAASNPTFTSSLDSAIGSLGDVAAGNQIGQNNSQWQALRDRIMSDTTGAVNSSFNNSGLFGSDSNRTALARGLSEGLAGVDNAQLQSDYARQQSAAGQLPSLFSSLQLPASVTQQVGAAQDANAQAQQTGELDWLTRLLGANSAAAGAAGTTTAEQQPLWKILLGTAATAAGTAAKGGTGA